MNLQNLANVPSWQWSGKKAGEIIANALRDKNAPAPDRVLAAELAGDIVVMDDNMADLLLSLVRDNSEAETLRCKAAISLGPGLEYADSMGFDGYSEDDALSEEKFNDRAEKFALLKNTDNKYVTYEKYEQLIKANNLPGSSVDRIREIFAGEIYKKAWAGTPLQKPDGTWGRK